MLIISLLWLYCWMQEGARGKWNFGFDESQDSFPPTWHHRRTFSISLPPIETMRVLSFLLLAAPCLVSCFTLNTRKNQPTVVQRAIQSKWTMMPEEPQPEVSAILIIATPCHFHVSPKSFSRISSRLHLLGRSSSKESRWGASSFSCPHACDWYRQGSNGCYFAPVEGSNSLVGATSRRRSGQCLGGTALVSCQWRSWEGHYSIH